MISHIRIAEILHQAVTDELLRKDGERQAYEDFIMNTSPDDSIEKLYTYIQDEQALAEITKEEGLSYEDWKKTLGRLDAYIKIREAIKKYGE